MFADLHKRAKKAGQPPGTLVYTGEQKLVIPRITVTTYDADHCQEVTGTTAAACFPEQTAPPPVAVTPTSGVTWVNVEGLRDVDLVNQVATRFKLHPLTVEDILNVEQRSKVEEFNDYVFVTLRMLLWNAKQSTFSVEQVSIVFGAGFLLSFQERDSGIFTLLKERLINKQALRLRQQGSDYLAYRLIDTLVDQYFVVLEALGDQIEQVEELIITNPKTENLRTLYQLKRHMLLVRKAVWPLREAVNHLMQVESGLVTSFTLVYLRDVYDHAMQAIDTVETFRDMLAAMLDVYLSTLTNRMNEIMKVLTIISTIFIPTTFIASIYGMNFVNMPELHWRWGYPVVLGSMLVVTLFMLNFFRRKKWL